jgi:predicted enzyme related to lactoylglutathione lyase
MIKKMSHTTIYVTNQDEALKFYTEKLGFEVRTDAAMDGGLRWLTLGLKMEPKAGMLMDEETTRQLRAIIGKGVLGAGVFDTDDCLATYEELKGRGVEFMGPPAERPYGIEALFKDNSGNWFSLTQRK